MDITELTVHELQEKIKNKELTITEITKAYVDRIKEKEPEVAPEDFVGFKCKFCGKVYDKKRALSMHMGTTHADELANL